MLVLTQDIIEAILQPMLSKSGGPVDVIVSLPFRPGELTEQAVESNRVRLPACVLAYPTTESFDNTAPASGGQDCYPTVTVRQIVGFMASLTNPVRQKLFVNNVRVGLFRTLLGHVPTGDSESPTGNQNQSRIARFDISTARFEYAETQVVAEFEIVTVIQFVARGLPYGN